MHTINFVGEKNNDMADPYPLAIIVKQLSKYCQGLPQGKEIGAVFDET